MPSNSAFRLSWAALAGVLQRERTLLQEPSRFIPLALGSALLLGMLLTFVARTPRGRLNVSELVTALLYISVILGIRTSKMDEVRVLGTTQSRRSWLLLAWIMGAAVYASTLSLPFISDDFVYLFRNHGLDLRDLWPTLALQEAPTFFRPVGYASLLFDFRLWHDAPAGYHAMNLLLHGACIAGLFCLVRRLCSESETASAAALIFCVLPIHVEAVAWIAARFDLLATCLSLWSIVLYVRYRSEGRFRLYAGALALCGLAIFSKESAYVMPALVLTVELWALPQRRIKPVLGFVGLAAAAFVLRWIILSGIGGYASPDGNRSALQIGPKTLEGLLLRGPTQMLLGFNGLQPPPWETIGLVSLTSALFLALAAIARPSRGRSKLIVLALTWIILPNVPAHFLLLIGSGLTNSRVLYFASAGVAILVACLLSGLRHARLRRICTGLLVLLLALGLVHNLRAWHWSSTLSERLLVELKQLEPSPPQDTELRFHHLPGTVRGVFFFHEGLQDAINLAYGRTDIRAYRVSDLRLEDTAGAGPRNAIEIEWRGEGNRLIERIHNQP
ncbi:MAG: glycosyltransferase family 39 protein [Acidobacteria bacterium]|nr:glycosyltransferase family 39 protein [Acidobacteriota bacterium]